MTVTYVAMVFESEKDNCLYKGTQFSKCFYPQYDEGEAKFTTIHFAVYHLLNIHK